VDLAELLSLPGTTEELTLRSAVGFMALHGGSQDRGTDRLARAAAERSGASFYGIVQAPWSRVHLTSRRHDPAHSDALRQFLDHVKIAISVHGYGRDSFALRLEPQGSLVIEPYGPPMMQGQRGPLRSVILGGLHEELLAASRDLFEDRIDGYQVGRGSLRLGFHPKNPVNLPVHRGVQIELPPGLRGIGPFGDRPSAEDSPLTDAVIDALVELAGIAGTLLGE
jgi:phage replication-related protein YjqB (UPF0714/DUF867 family)